ncbi:bifunctional diguanylate cyclase/phosphodiesterase [Rhizobium laguerreae]|uniref:Bifunctional diguanylate cyclase/phosphodiesterase n=1 Tax=Rhizobium laguerreae TaxID=1076926 RepID=A0AB35FG59_9HYPH|nr:bifunctional diguanylate cyclase/phosphodiesterase [Rhizobium laguerreae]MBY3064765.1 bifunctional diguanylate cyclase/phosphodiesterase [Rhizobium laguerreae]
MTYLAWAINVLDEKDPIGPSHITVQLNESVYLGLLITLVLFSFGAWQYIVQRQEIERRIIAERRARHLAYHDSLTGLENRRSLEEELANSLESGSDNLTRNAILMLDFDHFKKINDVHGHAIGDAFLQTVSTRMLQVVQMKGSVGRLGGDEFAIFLKNCSEGTDFETIARKLISAICEPIDIAGVVLMPEVSIGVVEIAGSGSVSELLRMADLALDRAKSQQGSCFLFYESFMEEDFRRGKALHQDLSQALRLGQFRVFYQPLVNSENGRTSSYEALLRWIHPEHGLVSPMEFVPLAEETGLISSIGKWVLYQACRDATTWPKTIKVSVNVSPRQFLDCSLPSIVEAALAATGLPANRLVLEITETVLLHESEANMEILRKIRATGVAIALDDFGTGFSSLSYLQNFPFDTVKIDRSFVQRIGTSPRSEKILQAIMELFTSLGTPVTVEGIETEAQKEWVSRIGCRDMQGFLFDYPRPLVDIPMLSEI